MKISKTLFKNLSRCHNFISLYDMYINRGLNEVREIEGTIINKEYLDKISSLEDNLFGEENEKMNEIFQEMFDIQTGEDLLNINSIQLEAFSQTFIEVERLACCYIEKVFKHKLISSTHTYEQKKYSYREKDHTFYCYLDAYFEDEETIKVFEVKATTSKKYDDFTLNVNKLPYKFFIKDKDDIIRYNNIDTNCGNEKQLSKLLKKQNILLDRYTNEGKYIYDLAVERNIIENSLKQKKNIKNKKVEYYLVILNSNYTFNGKYNGDMPVYDMDENKENLFKIYDMNDLTELYQKQIEEEKRKILEWEKYLTIKERCLGRYCEYKKTTVCKFHKICMKEVLKEGSILEYLRKQSAFRRINNDNKIKYIDVFELINQGLYKIDDVRDYLNKNDNIIQYDCYVNNRIYIDKLRIKEAIEKIEYPIYYLDFESYNCPLPRFMGEHPYTQSLFQYSLHIEKEPTNCDIVNDHKEYLAKDHLDHRLDLIKKLINDIDLKNGGTVIVYNKSFEKTRLKELSIIFKEQKDALDNINHHIFDLLEVIRGSKDFFSINDSEKPSFTYYNNLMHGSFSIKKILPLFTNLTYNNLDVKNGNEAILTYGLLPKLSQKEYEEKYLALKVYCRQDTWAMVEILRGLRKMIEK